MPRLRQKFLIMIFGVGVFQFTALAEGVRDQKCIADGKTAKAYITVNQLKTNEGKVRIQAYGDSKEDFLEKGKKLLREEHKAKMDDHQVCVHFPKPGRYALVVMHDRNGNGKADFFTEGFGFSRNPQLGLGAPDFEDVVVDIPVGVTKFDINLKYLWNTDKEKAERRRRMRRR